MYNGQPVGFQTGIFQRGEEDGGVRFGQFHPEGQEYLLEEIGDLVSLLCEGLPDNVFPVKVVGVA